MHICVLQQAMRPPGYAYSGAMPGQPRPHMAMGQGNMGMPQGAMSPVMSGVGNMQAPQVCQDQCVLPVNCVIFCRIQCTVAYLFALMR